MAWSAGQRYIAEFLGTFILLFVGGGTAVFTFQFSGLEAAARVIVVSLAFGGVLAALAYTFGDISGGHFNPAVTISMAVSRRMPTREIVPYLIAQIVGGIVGIAVVAGIASGFSSFYTTSVQPAALGSQCYAGNGSPCNFSLGSVFLLELAITFAFILVIQFVTRAEASAKNLAPAAIGGALLIGNLLAIPVDGASLNPVRSFSPALLSAGWSGSTWAIDQSWLFWVAPILGGILAGLVEMWLRPKP